jgi:NAD(P)-dependent dehydrogenase (short-subunit alcohol dehydrogenase family)
MNRCLPFDLAHGCAGGTGIVSVDVAIGLDGINLGGRGLARLQGKTALITGAGAGIGRAAAILFASEGARVGVAEIVRERGEATVSAIKAAGGEAIFIETDVSKPASVEAAVWTTVNAFDGLDVLYNNAGGATPGDGKVTEIGIEEFRRTIGVDLLGTFLGCRFALPVMAERGGGSIINTTSIRALIGTAGADAYTAAKGGVLALTRALALQWAAQNIRVNAIAPGVVLSERVRALLRDDDPLIRKSLLGPGQPEDIAQMALFLASDESARITGAILPVDSGGSAI